MILPFATSLRLIPLLLSCILPGLPYVSRFPSFTLTFPAPFPRLPQNNESTPDSISLEYLSRFVSQSKEWVRLHSGVPSLCAIATAAAAQYTVQSSAAAVPPPAKVISFSLSLSLSLLLSPLSDSLIPSDSLVPSTLVLPFVSALQLFPVFPPCLLSLLPFTPPFALVPVPCPPLPPPMCRR